MSCEYGSRMPLRLRELYGELGFTSLLQEIAPAAPTTAATDYAALDSPAALRRVPRCIPRRRRKPPCGSRSIRKTRTSEGFGARVLGVEVSTKPGAARTAANDVENKTLAAMSDWLADPKRPKIVHDPKLFHLLAASANPRGGANAVAGIRHATMLYSYLLRPTTANHAFAEVVLRHLNRTLSGAPGERADFLLRLAPVLARGSRKAGPRGTLRNDRPAARARARAHGSRRRPRGLSRSLKESPSRRRKK